MLEKGRPRGLFLSDRFCGRPTAYVIREDAAFGFHLVEGVAEPAEVPALPAPTRAKRRRKVE